MKNHLWLLICPTCLGVRVFLLVFNCADFVILATAFKKLMKTRDCEVARWCCLHKEPSLPLGEGKGNLGARRSEFASFHKCPQANYMLVAKLLVAITDARMCGTTLARSHIK